jgi:putative ABC transport system substrate-binding protein
MMAFKDNVDFIYTGSSGSIQAALPAIAAAADAMSIPLFNFNADEVKSNLALASFGVSHKQVGANTAIIVDKILKGENPSSITPIYPGKNDHSAYINLKKAAKLGIVIPKNIQQNITLVE